MDKIIFTPQQKLDLKEQEILLLKMALRDTVREKEIVCGFLAETNDVLLIKLAENKALRKEIEALRMYINWG